MGGRSYVLPGRKELRFRRCGKNTRLTVLLSSRFRIEAFSNWWSVCLDSPRRTECEEVAEEYCYRLGVHDIAACILNTSPFVAKVTIISVAKDCPGGRSTVKTNMLREQTTRN